MWYHIVRWNMLGHIEDFGYHYKFPGWWMGPIGMLLAVVFAIFLIAVLVVGLYAIFLFFKRYILVQTGEYGTSGKTNT